MQCVSLPSVTNYHEIIVSLGTYFQAAGNEGELSAYAINLRSSALT